MANGNNGYITSPESAIINLNQGDPTAFEPYWRRIGKKCTAEIGGGDLMSYFSDAGNLCWFMVPELAESIKRLHRTVGNAAVEDRYVLVGTGSTQLFQAVLYALTSPGGPEPVSVVSTAPYYSAYEQETEYLRSGLYKWEGDAYTFNKEGPYIEIVNSPNNPDGTIREAVVKRAGGYLVHDLAYYWPHYTPITCPADHDIMLFTFSKCTGHAGSRIGWALVKDIEVVKKMVKYMELSSLGASKESQIRAAKILGAVSDGCKLSGSVYLESFFEYGKRLMAARWEKLKQLMKRNNVFTLITNYPPQRCLFTGEVFEAHPAFAWMKSKEGVEDAANFLSGLKILTRNGTSFGTDASYVRVSMVSKDEEFNLFLERLSSIQGISNGIHK